MLQNNKATILICDDTPGWLDAMTAVLENEFNVVKTTNVEQAIQKLELLGVLFSVLITDIRLNELDPKNQDGLKLVEIIKQTNRSIGLIVITGHGTEVIAMKALRDFRVDDYIRKISDDGKFDIQDFRNRVRQVVNKYRRRILPTTILHLSDLHFSEIVDPLQLLQPLLMDIRSKDGDGIGFDYLNYLVISGNLTNRASAAEFERAREFVAKLMQEFKLSPNQCIFVPGNHDLSWEEEVYQWVSERKANTQKLPNSHKVRQGGGYLVRQEKRYPNRFKNFVNHFFYPLIQEPYPLKFNEQFSTRFDVENKLQFLALNSCCDIDEHFPHRSSIHMGALTRGLQQAEAEIKAAIANQQIIDETEILRIAVWHHPITGNEKILEDAFLEQLQRARFKICLHGHVHEDRTDLIGYTHPTRKIHIAGAGSFGAPANSRPESTPRLYNLLEIAADRSEVKVHTRRLRKASGAWEGYPEWPKKDGKPYERIPFYIIPLPRSPSLPSEPNSNVAPGGTVINTGGGPYIAGDVNTGGGDFVGRDKG